MAAEIAARLRDMIDEGELPPGSRIDEKELSRQFDVSKTPLREALKVLVSEGRATHRQYIGYRVAEIDLEDLVATFELLHGLEAMAGELVQQRITVSQVTAIAAKHRRMMEYHVAGRRVAYFKLNQQIHQMLIDIADNPVLSKIYSTLMAKVYRARSAANTGVLRWAESAKEHEEIFRALEDPAHKNLPMLLKDHSIKTAQEVLTVFRCRDKEGQSLQPGDSE